MKQRKWTKEAFEKFDAAHPHIWKKFEELALFATTKRKHYSAGVIFGYMRWSSEISGDFNGEFKIDDGWRSHYAHKFMDKYPEHEGFFSTRARWNSYHNPRPSPKLSNALGVLEKL